MAYVDLNPIRAGIAATPEESEFTSIYERIRELKATSVAEEGTEVKVPLLPFRSPSTIDQASIPFRLEDYLELVDWTGRAIRGDKRGAIDAQLPPIAQRLKIDPEAWTRAMRPGGNVFGRAIGLSVIRDTHRVGRVTSRLGIDGCPESLRISMDVLDRSRDPRFQIGA